MINICFNRKFVNCILMFIFCNYEMNVKWDYLMKCVIVCEKNSYDRNFCVFIGCVDWDIFV